MHLQYVLLQTKISNNQGIQLFIYYISKYTFIYLYVLSIKLYEVMYEDILSSHHVIHMTLTYNR